MRVCVFSSNRRRIKVCRFRSVISIKSLSKKPLRVAPCDFSSKIFPILSWWILFNDCLDLNLGLTKISKRRKNMKRKNTPPQTWNFLLEIHHFGITLLPLFDSSVNERIHPVRIVHFRCPLKKGQVLHLLLN